MSWYCDRWTSNIASGISDGFEDGDDCDDIFTDNRCNSFNTGAWATVDQHNSVLDRGVDEDNDATCNEHDRDATWEADFSTAADLRDAGYFVCDDDDETFHTQEAYNAHTDAHDNPDASTDFIWIDPRTPRRRPTTSHASWAATR